MKTIIRLSSTALSNSNCILKFHNVVISGYHSTPLASAVYGVAFHKYVDTMYKTKGDVGKSIENALKAFRVPKIDDEKKPHLMEERHMITVCTLMWEQIISSEFNILEVNGEPLTEKNFSLKYYEDDDIEVYLEGTIDSIGKFSGGCYAIRDFKTTSYWDIKKYMIAYELSRQLRHYRLAMKIMSEREPDSTLGKIGATKMGAFIHALHLKPIVSDCTMVKNDVRCFTDKEIEDYRKSLDDYIHKISSAVRTGYLPQEGILNGTCDGKYGLCNFWNVCKASDEGLRNALLKKDFTIKQFNPLDYNE